MTTRSSILSTADTRRPLVAAAAVREFARGALAHFKVPSAFEFVSALPKTATGKVQKYVLRGKRANIAQQ